MKIILGRVLHFLALFINYKVMLSIFSPQDYGIINLFILVTSFAILFIIGPMGSYIMRVCVELNKKGKLVNELSYIIYGSILLTLVNALFIIISMVIFPNFHKIYLLFPIFFITSSIIQTFISLVGILRSLNVSVFLNVINTLGSLLFCILVHEFISNDIIAWMFAQTILQGFFCIFIFKKILILKLTKFSFNKISSFFKSRIKFFGVLSSISGFSWVMFQAPKAFLGMQLDTQEFGILIAGLTFSMYLLSGCENLINTYALTNFYRKCSKTGPEKAWKEYFIYVYKFTLMGSILALFFLDLTKNLILTDEFVKAQKFIYIGIIIEAVRIISTSTFIVAQAMSRPSFVFFCQVFASIWFLAIILYLFFTNIIYENFTILFVFSSSLLYLIIFFLGAYKKYSFYLIFDETIDLLKFTFGLLVVCIAYKLAFIILPSMHILIILTFSFTTVIIFYFYLKKYIFKGISPIKLLINMD